MEVVTVTTTGQTATIISSNGVISVGVYIFYAYGPMIYGIVDIHHFKQNVFHIVRLLLSHIKIFLHRGLRIVCLDSLWVILTLVFSFLNSSVMIITTHWPKDGIWPQRTEFSYGSEVLVHMPISLQWRHNKRDGISNLQRLDCLLDVRQVQIKENIKAPRQWTSWMESTVDWWILFLCIWTWGVRITFFVAADNSEHIIQLVWWLTLTSVIHMVLLYVLSEHVDSQSP